MGVPAGCIPIGLVYRIVKYDVRACTRSNIFTLHAEKKQRFFFLKEKAHGCFEMDIRLLIRKRMYITVQFLSGSHRSSLKCGECSNPYFVKMPLP